MVMGLCKDVQGEVCWGLLVKCFSSSCGRGFLWFCSVRDLELQQPSSSQHEVEPVMKGDPQPRGAQRQGLWASGFRQLWNESILTGDLQLYEPHITLYLSLFQLHFSVTHRLRFHYYMLLWEFGLHFPTHVYSHWIDACLFFRLLVLYIFNLEICLNFVYASAKLLSFFLSGVFELSVEELSRFRLKFVFQLFSL